MKPSLARLKSTLMSESLRVVSVGNRPVLRLLSLLVSHYAKTVDCFRLESARMIETAFGFVGNNEIVGDYCEFGVFQGATFAAASHARHRWQLDAMRLHAFDSFRGLPEMSEVDAEGVFLEGQFAAGRQVFERTLQRHRVDLARVTITEGMFDQSLVPERKQEIKLSRVAIAWIDCDLYVSTVPVLDFLTDVLVDGAVVAFDDWFCFHGRPDRGQQRACSEWLARNPELRLSDYERFHWAGKAFVVHRG